MCNNSNTWNLGKFPNLYTHHLYLQSYPSPQGVWLSPNNHAKVQAVSGRISICFFRACFRPCIGARSSRLVAPWLLRPMPVARGWKRRRSREEDTTMIEEHAMAAAAAAGGKWIPRAMWCWRQKKCWEKLFLNGFLIRKIGSNISEYVNVDLIIGCLLEHRSTNSNVQLSK